MHCLLFVLTVPTEASGQLALSHNPRLEEDGQEGAANSPQGHTTLEYLRAGRLRSFFRFAKDLLLALDTLVLGSILTYGKHPQEALPKTQRTVCGSEQVRASQSPL